MEEHHENSIDKVFECIAPYIHDTSDRNSFSLVCRKCCEAEGKTRKHVTVQMCYATTPLRFRQRFPFIESLTLQGKPTAFPWVQEITTSFNLLKAVHFHHLNVTDREFELLAKTRGKELRVLEIESCGGFTTFGLLHIGTYCNELRSLSLQNSQISNNWITRVKDDIWLHELAMRNMCIESLNFYKAHRLKYDVQDLVLIAKNCSESLVSVKISKEYDFFDLVDFFNYAVNLEDFSGGSFSMPFGARANVYTPFKFPSKLKYFAMNCVSLTELRLVEPFAHLLTELDLRGQYNRADPCFVLIKCPNLEVLYTMYDIGDSGLRLISQYCKKMRKLYNNRGISTGNAMMSHMGLIDLAQGCLDLECLHIYLTSITNEAMSYIGIHLKKLNDFNMILLRKYGVPNIPLDNGIRALLISCNKLERLSICFQQFGGLTDVGLGYIGKYGRNLRYLTLSYTGESDAGLVELSYGCPKLQNLEMRICPFSKDAIDIFMCNVTSLKYYSFGGISYDCRKYRTSLVRDGEDISMKQLKIS